MQALVDSLKIGTLSAEIASFSGFVPINISGTVELVFRLCATYGLLCELRGD